MPDAELNRLLLIQFGESQETMPPLHNVKTLTDEELDILLSEQLTSIPLTDRDRVVQLLRDSMVVLSEEATGTPLMDRLAQLFRDHWSRTSSSGPLVVSSDEVQPRIDRARNARPRPEPGAPPRVK